MGKNSRNIKIKSNPKRRMELYSLKAIKIWVCNLTFEHTTLVTCAAFFFFLNWNMKQNPTLIN